MKRSAQVVMLLGIALAQSAWSGEGHMAFENDPRDRVEPYANVAAIGSVVRDAGDEGRPVRPVEDMLESIGLAGHGPFPSRGGLIDD